MNLFSEKTERELSQDIVQLVTATIDTVQSQQSDQKRYLNQKEAAEYCDVSVGTLKSWVIEHELKKIQIEGVTRYDREDLDEFMTVHKI